MNHPSPYLQNFTHKTKDRVTRTPLKTGGELMSSRRVSSSWSTSGTRLVTLFINPMISHEWWKNRKMYRTSGKYPWSFVTPKTAVYKVKFTICSSNTTCKSSRHTSSSLHNTSSRHEPIDINQLMQNQNHLQQKTLISIQIKEKTCTTGKVVLIMTLES